MPDAPDKQEQQQNGDRGNGASGGETPTTWAEFVAAHPEAQALYDAETASLKGALEKEREKAKAAEKSLRELAKTADPELADRLRKQADEMKAEAEAAKAELNFISEAVRIGCRAPDKAWVVARASGMTLEQMKADPDYGLAFFTRPAADAKGGAGARGTGRPLSENERINQGIRAAAGRT